MYYEASRLFVAFSSAVFIQTKLWRLQDLDLTLRLTAINQLHSLHL